MAVAKPKTPTLWLLNKPQIQQLWVDRQLHFVKTIRTLPLIGSVGYVQTEGLVRWLKFK